MSRISFARKSLAGFVSGALVCIGLASIGVAPAAAATENLALASTVTASGQEVTGQWGPELTKDGKWAPDERNPNNSAVPPSIHNLKTASRWSAGPSTGPWWIQYEFAAKARINEVIAQWGNTYATEYTISTSNDGSEWTTMPDKLAATEQTQKVTTKIGSDTAPVEARFLRVTITKKSQNYAISLWELAVNGELVEEPLANDSIAITPKPLSAKIAADENPFTFTENTCVSLSTNDLTPAADILREGIETPFGVKLPVKSVGSNCAVTFTLDTTLDAPKGQDKEAYKIVSNSDKINVTASSVRGAIWAAQSLLQLIGPWTHAEARLAGAATVPAVTILDAPRYEWRGVMLDPARSFIPVDEVKNYIDLMSSSKLNVLHMHISEDQGWRLEISNEGKDSTDKIDYSLLTTKSSLTSYMAGSSKLAPEAGRTGYYTKNDYAEIIKYAASRGIAVISEVDGPGHTNSALHAIAELNTSGASPKPPAGKTTTDPFVDGQDGFGTLDVGSNDTYTFMQHVINDITKQHEDALKGIANTTLRNEVTLPYFHIGGDESTSGGDGYKNYISKVSGFATAKNFTPMVWNDAADKAGDNLAKDSIVQHWNGSTDSLKSFVTNKNGRVLMSTVTNAYYPQRPGSDVAGPTWACTNGCPLSNWYNWDPTAKAGVAEKAVIGVESALWQEHLRTDHDAQFVMWPRTFALAEVGWTQAGLKDYTDFRARLGDLGINMINRDATFRLSAPNDVDGVTWKASYAPLKLANDAKLSTDEALEIGLIALPGVATADTNRLPLTATVKDAKGGEHKVTLSYSMDKAFNYTDENKTTGRQMNSIIRVSATLADPVCVGGAGTPSTATTNGSLNISGTVAAADRAPQLVVNSVPSASVKLAEQCPAKDAVIADISDQTVTIGEAITDITPSVTDGTVTAVNGLPDGVSHTEGKITGTPTTEGTFHVTVTAKNADGKETSTTFTITVNKKPDDPTKPSDPSGPVEPIDPEDPSEPSEGNVPSGDRPNVVTQRLSDTGSHAVWAMLGALTLMLGGTVLAARRRHA